MREWLKTLRKKNASVIFATQSLSDIDGSAIAPAIIESCPTRLFLPNERAIEPQITAIYRRFGLNDRQIEILARATPKRDYYCQSRRGNRLFELGLGDVALAFTAASAKSDQAAIEKILAEHGRGGFVAAWLTHRGVGWAADLIPDLSSRGNINMIRIRHLAAASVVALLDRFTTASSSAQVVVFDPNNYAQNVLTAARALQQINNQITSLQNQAQMLINQAKNLASLPYSSLQQLQSSIQRTQQLLTQAQRIAYDVQQIDHAFSTTYAPASSGTSSQTLIANAQARWQTSVAALQDALRVQAGVVGNLDTNRTQMSALVTSSQSATGALQATAGRQSACRSAGAATRGSDRDRRGTGSGSESGSRAAHRRAGPGQGAAPALPDAGRRLSVHQRSDVPLMSRCLTPRQFARIAAARFRRLDRRLGRHPAAGVAKTPASLRHWSAAKRTRLPPNWRAAGRSHRMMPQSLETCRRVWAENRRQFFRSTKTPQQPADPVPTAACAIGKNQDRVSPVEAEHQQSEVR